MAQIPGTNVSAPVVPNDTNDVFPSAYSQHIAGGLHTGENTIADRDATTPDRRQWGMEVQVFDGTAFTTYVLVRGTASQDITDNNNWVEVTGADVNKAYVDAANAALGTRIDAAGASAAHANDRFDTLVANAPQALDTLKEISDQLAADKQGTAAILATQQQHTQQLANDVVHRTGNETIDGNKHFSQSVVVDGSVTATAFLGDGSQLTGLPTSGDTFAGDWNPATNMPALTQGVGRKGTYYRVSASNTVLATTANGPSSSTVIGLASVTGIQPGMLVTGYGIANNTTVVSISGKNLTLSAAVNGIYGGAPVTAFSIPFGVSMPTFLPGSELFYNGTAWMLRALPLLPATDVQLGGILVGDGLSVNTNGTLAVLPQLAGAYNSSTLYAPNVAVTYSGKLYQNTSGFSIISATPGVGFGWKLLDLTGYVPASSGALSSLTTTNKTTLVAAINELKASSGSSPASTDALPEGSTNRYYTDARAQAAVSSQLAAKADLVNGIVPLANLPYKAGTNITIAGDGTISAAGGSQAPDLTPYARKDQENNFTESQYVRQMDEDSGALYGFNKINYTGQNITRYSTSDGVARQGNLNLSDDSFVMQLVNNGTGKATTFYFTNGDGIVSDLKNGGVTLTSSNGSTGRITYTDNGKLALNGVELSAGGGGSSVTVEQDLSSNSTASVPSVAAVKAVANAKADLVNGMVQPNQINYGVGLTEDGDSGQLTVSFVTDIVNAPVYTVATTSAIKKYVDTKVAAGGGSTTTLPPVMIPLVLSQGAPIATTAVDTSQAGSIVIGSDFVWDSGYVAGGKTVLLEMCSSASAGKTMAASLYTLAGVNVANSGISGFSSSPGLARTGTFTLVHGTTYQVRIAIGSSGTGYLHSARLVIK